MTDPEQTDNPSDPRMQSDDADGTPPPLVDTAHNMPGDQPEDDTPPSRTKATGDA